MFKSLKSKLKGWIGKEDPDSPKSQESKTLDDDQSSESRKKNKPLEEKPVETPKVKKTEKKIPEEIKEEIVETPEKKKGFLSKLFSSDNDTEKPVEVEKLEAKIDIPTKQDVKDLKKALDDEKITEADLPTDEVDSPKNLSPQQSEELKGESEIDSKEVEKIDKEVPQKFEVGQESFQPDTEKIEAELKEPQTEQKGFLSRFTSKINTTTLKQEHVDEIFENLEIILLENNVALEVVDKIKENLDKDLIGIEVKKGKLEEIIIQTLKDSIEEVLIEPPNLIKDIKKHKGPYTIIFFGINGSGKTTSIAKLAHKLKSQGLSVVLAAGDTFRAAAIQQLETHAKKLDIPIIKHDYNSDPTAVAFDAKKYAEQHNIDVCLIDTAGRMYTKENLIKQMEKIIRVIQPELKIFVGESITGNDGTEQAKTFHEAVGIDGIILSKADVDEKAGTILSVSYVTGKPIYFLGVGQNYEDLQEFTKQNILKNLGLD